MVLAADYPFLNILWTMIIFFVWVVWIWMMIAILSDIFRRHDLSGWSKAAWTVFLLVLPFLGALIYLISNGDGMAHRNAERAQAQRAGVDEKAKGLLDSGVIDQAEFEALKAKALASLG